MKTPRGHRPHSTRTTGSRTNKAKPHAGRTGRGPHSRTEIWNLRLYVAGQTPRSLSAFANLKQLCEQHLPGRYKIEVIDLIKNPELARTDQVIALPTLVRKLPEPIKRIIGDLSNSERVRIGMDLVPMLAAHPLEP